MNRKKREVHPDGDTQDGTHTTEEKGEKGIMQSGERAAFSPHFPMSLYGTDCKSLV